MIFSRLTLPSPNSILRVVSMHLIWWLFCRLQVKVSQVKVRMGVTLVWSVWHLDCLLSYVLEQIQLYFFFFKVLFIGVISIPSTGLQTHDPEIKSHLLSGLSQPGAPSLTSWVEFQPSCLCDFPYHILKLKFDVFTHAFLLGILIFIRPTCFVLSATFSLISSKQQNNNKHCIPGTCQEDTNEFFCFYYP